MATKIVASELINIVRYQTDRNSLNQARKKMRALKKEFETDAVKQSKAEVKRIREAADAEVQQAKRVAREKAKAENQTSGKRGGKTQAERDAARLRREQEKALAKQRKAEERAVMQTANRQAKADHLLRSRSFDLNRLTDLDQSQRYAALRQVHKITEEYKQQKISLQQATEALRQNLAIQKSIARQQRTANKRSGKPNQSGNTNWLTMGALLASPIGQALSIGGAGYLAYGAASDALSGAMDRQQGRKMMQAQGLDPFEGEAIRRAITAQTGQDFSADKLADIAKDTQDKVGQLSLGSWNKQGQYSGGGELGDWLQIMTTRGGYSREGALSTLQNAKGPGEMAVILQNLKKSAKLTDSEVTALAETINDFSYVVKAAGDGGKNFTDTMFAMAQTGQQLSDRQQEAVNYLNQMSKAADNVGNSLQDQFSASFGQAMIDAGISTKSLDDSFAAMRPTVRALGDFAGETTAHLIDFSTALANGANWINSHLFGSKKDVNESGWYYNDSALGSIINGARGWFGYDPNSSVVSKYSPQSIINPASANPAQTSIAGYGYNTQSALDQRYGNLAISNPYTLQTPKFEFEIHNETNVNTNDDRLMGVFSAHTQQEILNTWDDMTFQVNNMTSNN